MSHLDMSSGRDSQLVAWQLTTAFDRLIAQHDWQRLFQIVRAKPFLAALKKEARLPTSDAGSTTPPLTPLTAIDRALDIAIELRDVPVVAGLMLVRADWGGRPVGLAPLEALRTGQHLRPEMLGGGQPDRAILWELVLAWE